MATRPQYASSITESLIRMRAPDCSAGDKVAAAWRARNTASACCSASCWFRSSEAVAEIRDSMFVRAISQITASSKGVLIASSDSVPNERNRATRRSSGVNVRACSDVGRGSGWGFRSQPASSVAASKQTIAPFPPRPCRIRRHLVAGNIFGAYRPFAVISFPERWIGRMPLRARQRCPA